MPTIRAEQARAERPTRRARLRLLAFAVGLAVLAGPALAQGGDTTPMRPGEAFLTRFSGTAAGAGGRAIIDLDGTVGSIVDLRNPGFPAQGQHWIDEPQRLPVTARDVGQVYGVALDDQSPPNVYLTATAAFGLHRTEDGRDWLPGQWGPGAAGPGAVWKLDARRNYAPQLLATVTLDGRPNSAAALGNITFDKAHRQLLVSDLETGMIHRLSLDGRDLGRFDHGVEGRAAYFDVSAGRNAALPPVAFDPNSRARIDDCAEGRFTETPACWNIADPRRRIWGLAVRTDSTQRETRLYYAVWSGLPLGTPGFADIPEAEKTGTVWSVRLGPDGGFDRSSVRRELEVPEFFVGQDDFRRAGPSWPVADIAFPDCIDQGIMILSERGGLRNLGLDAEEPFATPRESRVLRYEMGEDGAWKAVGRYDVGFSERKPPAVQPFLRAGASGAAAFGYGYDEKGAIDPTRPNQSLWMAGDHLCSPEGPCFNPGSGAFDDDSQVHGIQGTPEPAFAELAPNGAFRVYPVKGRVSNPDGPAQSYMIDADVNVDADGKPNPSELARNDATMIGDIAIWQPCEGQAAAVPPPPPPAEIVRGPVDLWIRKSGFEECDFDGICSFTVTISAIGEGTWVAPIFIRDFIPEGAELVSFTPADPWMCDVIDALFCFRPTVTLQPGEDIVLRIRIRMPEAILVRAPLDLQNCIALEWPFADPDDGPAIQLATRNVLILMGYLQRTEAAIEPAIQRFERDMRLPQTGRIGPRLTEALFGGLARMIGDNDPQNDLACVPFRVPPRPPVLDGHSRRDTHRRFGSIEHSRWQTHRRWDSPAHNPWQSHLRWGSVVLPPIDLHNRAETHARWGSVWHSRVRTHRRDGSFPPQHDLRLSHDRFDSFHSLAMSHYRGSSIHKVERSHYRFSSIHGKKESHDRWGSLHDRRETHRRDGSIHARSLSHTKAQSLHALDRSHAKAGSTHGRRESLAAGGFGDQHHTRAQSHFKAASAGHDPSGNPFHDKRASLGFLGKDKDKGKGKDKDGHDDQSDQGGQGQSGQGGDIRHNRLLSQSQRTGDDKGPKGHTVVQSRGGSQHSTAASAAATTGPTIVHTVAASRGTPSGHSKAASRGGGHSTVESAALTGPVIVHSKAASRGPIVHTKAASRGPVIDPGHDHGPTIVHSKSASRGGSGGHSKAASRGVIGPQPGGHSHDAGPVHSKKASKGSSGGGSIGPSPFGGGGGHAKKASKGSFGGSSGGGAVPFGGGGHAKQASKGSFGGGHSHTAPSGFGGFSKPQKSGGGSFGGFGGYSKPQKSGGGSFGGFGGGGGGHSKPASKGKLF